MASERADAERGVQTCSGTGSVFDRADCVCMGTLDDLGQSFNLGERRWGCGGGVQVWQPGKISGTCCRIRRHCDVHSSTRRAAISARAAQDSRRSKSLAEDNDVCCCCKSMARWGEFPLECVARWLPEEER
jgi:hypothetical protein